MNSSDRANLAAALLANLDTSYSYDIAAVDDALKTAFLTPEGRAELDAVLHIASGRGVAWFLLNCWVRGLGDAVFRGEEPQRPARASCTLESAQAHLRWLFKEAPLDTWGELLRTELGNLGRLPEQNEGRVERIVTTARMLGLVDKLRALRHEHERLSSS